MTIRDMTAASDLAKQLAERDYPTAKISSGFILRTGMYFEVPMFMAIPVVNKRKGKKKKVSRVSRYVQIPIVAADGPARWRKD